MSDLYQNCDVIVFTLPLTPDTHYILSSQDFLLLKNEVVLANVARGGIIQESGLIDFLSTHTGA